MDKDFVINAILALPCVFVVAGLIFLGITKDRSGDDSEYSNQSID